VINIDMTQAAKHVHPAALKPALNASALVSSTPWPLAKALETSVIIVLVIANPRLVPSLTNTLNTPPARDCESSSKWDMIWREPTGSTTSHIGIRIMTKNAIAQYDTPTGIKAKMRGPAAVSPRPQTISLQAATRCRTNPEARSTRRPEMARGMK
jgi:hypothetical protein